MDLSALIAANIFGPPIKKRKKEFNVAVETSNGDMGSPYFFVKVPPINEVLIRRWCSSYVDLKPIIRY